HIIRIEYYDPERACSTRCWWQEALRTVAGCWCAAQVAAQRIIMHEGVDGMTMMALQFSGLFRRRGSNGSPWLRCQVIFSCLECISCFPINAMPNGGRSRGGSKAQSRKGGVNSGLAASVDGKHRQLE